MSSVHEGYRVRDLVLGIGVMLMGAAMIYLFVLMPEGANVRLALQAFAAAGALMVLAWMGGSICERIGRTFPALARPRQSYVPHIIVAATALGSIALAYVRWQPLIDEWFATLVP